MAGMFFLNLPMARKQSKQVATLFILLAAAFISILPADVYFRFFATEINEWPGVAFLLIKAVLVLSGCCLLVLFHFRIKGHILHLEDKFLKVFNTSPHGMMIVRISDARIKEVNSAFVRVSGYAAEDVIGRTVHELGLWDQPEQRNEMLAVLLNYQSFGPVEIRFIPASRIPTRYLYSAQLIIIKGEKYLVSHIEEKPDRAQPGLEAITLLKQRLREIMTDGALFRVPGLTLSDLAEKLETNKTYLSQAINSEYGNFNEYLNKFRVIEACRLIQDGLDPRFSIDHLYLEVGFSSRTTFYNAFKKFTGVSPARFRQINCTATSAKSKSNS